MNSTPSFILPLSRFSGCKDKVNIYPFPNFSTTFFQTFSINAGIQIFIRIDSNLKLCSFLNYHIIFPFSKNEITIPTKSGTSCVNQQLTIKERNKVMINPPLTKFIPNNHDNIPQQILAILKNSNYPNTTIFTPCKQ